MESDDIARYVASYIYVAMSIVSFMYVIQLLNDGYWFTQSGKYFGWMQLVYCLKSMYDLADYLTWFK